MRGVMWRAIGRFRYIAWVKCPYRVASKASALRAGKRAPGSMPMQSCRQSASARRGKRYTDIGLYLPGPTPLTEPSCPGSAAAAVVPAEAALSSSVSRAAGAGCSPRCSGAS